MSESSQLDPAAIERLRRLGGDDFARKMLDLFLSYTEQKLSEARQAPAGGKLCALAKAVHPVQSSAGNVGATRVQALASRIEALAAESQGEPLELLLAELGQAFDDVKVALNEKKQALEAKAS